MTLLKNRIHKKKAQKHRMPVNISKISCMNCVPYCFGIALGTMKSIDHFWDVFKNGWVRALTYVRLLAVALGFSGRNTDEYHVIKPSG
jgi:hypothetical protein